MNKTIKSINKAVINSNDLEAKFTMNDHGHFMIEVDDMASCWVQYSSIAVVRLPNGKIYAGASAYYEGNLPHETVFEIVPIATEHCEC